MNGEPSVGSAVALFPHRSSRVDELSFDKGDVLTGYDAEVEPGWIVAELRGTIGLIPVRYVKWLSDSSSNAITTTPAIALKPSAPTEKTVPFTAKNQTGGPSQLRPVSVAGPRERDSANSSSPTLVTTTDVSTAALIAENSRLRQSLEQSEARLRALQQQRDDAKRKGPPIPPKTLKVQELSAAMKARRCGLRARVPKHYLRPWVLATDEVWVSDLQTMVATSNRRLALSICGTDGRILSAGLTEEPFGIDGVLVPLLTACLANFEAHDDRQFSHNAEYIGRDVSDRIQANSISQLVFCANAMRATFLPQASASDKMAAVMRLLREMCGDAHVGCSPSLMMGLRQDPLVTSVVFSMAAAPRSIFPLNEDRIAAASGVCELIYVLQSIECIADQLAHAGAVLAGGGASPAHRVPVLSEGGVKTAMQCFTTRENASVRYVWHGQSALIVLPKAAVSICGDIDHAFFNEILESISRRIK